jgi:hypothetical protein
MAPLQPCILNRLVRVSASNGHPRLVLLLFCGSFPVPVPARCSNDVLPHQVPQEVRQARRDALISQQQDISQEFAESLIGREVRSTA